MYDIDVAFVPDSEKIRNLHQRYFNEDPTDEQTRLYDAYPHAHGYSDSALDRERFRAVLNLALVGTIPIDGAIENTQPTFLFFPKPHERWVVDQIKQNAEGIFNRLREERRVDAAKFLGECFKALRLGHLVLQLPGAPERWVAFGFTDDGPVPPWMRGHLIST